jgi:hypothetical protein
VGTRLFVEFHRTDRILVTREAETGSVIYRVIKLVTFACCALVVMSFAMFARDQMAGASERQTVALIPGSAAAAAAAGGAPATPRHGQPRRFIDGAAKTLTAPFNAIVQSSNAWVEHGLPALFALLVYGLGLGYLARYSAGLARRSLG